MFRVLFTFPSRYSFTIGHLGVFSLTRWCWWIQAEFHRLRPTQDTDHTHQLTFTGLSPSMVRLSNRLQLRFKVIISVLQPREGRNPHGLDSSLFARHYWGNPYWFLFLWVLRCFSSPRWPPLRALSGCPIRISWDHGLFAPTPCFSQLTTSFIASRCLGILRILLLTFSLRLLLSR